MANRADTSDFEAGHPLAAQPVSMYAEAQGGYIYNRIEIIPNIAADSLTEVIAISGKDNLVPVEIEAPFFFERGLILKVTFRVNYLQWFENVDITSSDQDQLKNNIVQNIADSFTLVEVELN